MSHIDHGRTTLTDHLLAQLSPKTNNLNDNDNGNNNEYEAKLRRNATAFGGVTLKVNHHNEEGILNLITYPR